jgi:hypothetical protein
MHDRFTHPISKRCRTIGNRLGIIAVAQIFLLYHTFRKDTWMSKGNDHDWPAKSARAWSD